MTAAAPPPNPDGMGQETARPEYTFDEARAVGRGNPGAQWPAGDEDNRLWPECWPVVQPSFALSRDEPIFTIGSCFARNIERHLSSIGFDLPVLRLAKETIGEGNLNILNKYTPPSIRQELAWTKAIFDRDDTVGEADVLPFLLVLDNGRFVDTQRRNVDRGGLTLEQALTARRRFYVLFRQAFLCPVAIVTLGLVECWWDRETGEAVESSIHFKGSDRFVFRRLRYVESLEHTNAALDLLLEGGVRNVLITTSPVALSRTFTTDDVLVANTYSKSMLRTVAGEVAEARPEVDYFPSYESVMLTRRPEVWEPDNRHVSAGFVGRIMARVVETYAGEALTPSADAVLKFHTLARQARWGEAHEAFREVSELPEDTRARAHFQLAAAEMFVQLDKPDEARRAVEDVVARTLNGDDRMRLAAVYEALGGTQKAGRLRASSLSIRPGASGRTVKARVGRLIEWGRTDDALMVLAAIVETETAPEVLAAAAEMYARLGRTAEAEAARARAGEVPQGDELTTT